VTAVGQPVARRPEPLDLEPGRERQRRPREVLQRRVVGALALVAACDEAREAREVLDGAPRAYLKPPCSGMASNDTRFAAQSTAVASSMTIRPGAGNRLTPTSSASAWLRYPHDPQ
jgi:hypothetical protein